MVRVPGLFALYLEFETRRMVREPGGTIKLGAKEIKALASLDVVQIAGN
jgi:hypothetical protein